MYNFGNIGLQFQQKYYLFHHYFQCHFEFISHLYFRHKVAAHPVIHKRVIRFVQPYNVKFLKKYIYTSPSKHHEHLCLKFVLHTE